jgi:GNAT superfamily N-acetyltransferase
MLLAGLTMRGPDLFRGPPGAPGTRRGLGWRTNALEVDGTPAGFIDPIVFPDVAHGRSIGPVDNLVVDPRFRDRGLGASLLREAIHHCTRHGVVALHVWTDVDNTRAIRLHERLGCVGRALLLERQTSPSPRGSRSRGGLRARPGAVRPGEVRGETAHGLAVTPA